MNSVSESGTPPSVGLYDRSRSAGSSFESSSFRAISLMLVLSCLSLPSGLGAQKSGPTPDAYVETLQARAVFRQYDGGVEASIAARSELEQALEEHRRELTGYCYRMLASPFEAEDAVQETMLRAWKSLDRFEGRASLRSWLYKIATNVCLDMLGSKERKARPMDLGPSRE